MDFNQRSNRANHHGSVARAVHTHAGGNLRYVFVVLLFSIAVLLSALISSIALSGNNPGDGQFVDTKRYQAVFLNGGQVYFGHISRMASKSMVLNDIYYLKVNQQVQPGQPAGSNDVTLVKLGCELHGPEDQMVLNREQIIFWENLKDNGQVAEAIKNYKSQNPDGQKCESAPQTNNGGNTAPATTNKPPAATPAPRR